MTMTVDGYARHAKLLRLREEGHQLANADEAELLTALVRAGLPSPVCQFRIGRYRLDYAWPAWRVGVELDGPWHLTVDGRRRDRQRDAELNDWGWSTIRLRIDDRWDVDAIARLVSSARNLCHHELEAEVEARRQARRRQREAIEEADET